MNGPSRIIFIPGLGEDEFIFEKIQGAFSGEKLYLSLWKELPQRHAPQLNVLDFAHELVKKYHITKNDLLIGHSTGGWAAIHIKQVVAAPVIQLASWTESSKVHVPAKYRYLVYFAAQTGIYLNRFMMRYFLRKNYKDKPSSEVFKQVFTRLITGSRPNAVNQLRLVLNPVPQKLSVLPDLRIHARGDRVIGFPDGLVHEVPGDHFSLYTHPGEVIAPIQQFITDTYGQQ